VLVCFHGKFGILLVLMLLDYIYVMNYHAFVDTIEIS